jgi:hypothetical protein
MIVPLYVDEEILKLIGVEASSFEITEPFVYLALQMTVVIRIYRD